MRETDNREIATMYCTVLNARDSQNFLSIFDGGGGVADV